MNSLERMKMKITIECECGNKHTLEAPEKKYIQFRDNLEVHTFRYSNSDTKYNDGKVSRIMIHCDKCKNFIYLDLD